jgi:L-aminopeptidase/D-esterase-like protein
VLAHIAADPNPLAHLWSWVEVHTGAYGGGSGSSYYGFWSGFGSDITEFAILFSLIHVFRHANCHTKHCLRFGKPVDGTPYRACHKHHPDHEGNKRNVSKETIRDSFENRA